MLMTQTKSTYFRWRQNWKRVTETRRDRQADRETGKKRREGNESEGEWPTKTKHQREPPAIWYTTIKCVMGPTPFNHEAVEQSSKVFVTRQASLTLWESHHIFACREIHRCSWDCWTKKRAKTACHLHQFTCSCTCDTRQLSNHSENSDFVSHFGSCWKNVWVAFESVHDGTFWGAWTLTLTYVTPVTQLGKYMCSFQSQTHQTHHTYTCATHVMATENWVDNSDIIHGRRHRIPHGLLLLASWLCRNQPSLPHAVEVTRTTTCWWSQVLGESISWLTLCTSAVW